MMRFVPDTGGEFPVRGVWKERIFDQTLSDTRTEFADLAPEALQDLINEATEAVRNETRRPWSSHRRKHAEYGTTDG